jgi:hypothetical protein
MFLERAASFPNGYIGSSALIFLKSGDELDLFGVEIFPPRGKVPHPRWPSG